MPGFLFLSSCAVEDLLFDSLGTHNRSFAVLTMTSAEPRRTAETPMR